MFLGADFGQWPGKQRPQIFFKRWIGSIEICKGHMENGIKGLIMQRRCKRFKLEYLHLYQNVIFDFDVSIFTSDNFDDCIRDIGSNLSSQRAATFPYVQAFLMFGTYVNHQLKDKSWYKENMLITALKNVLDENGFRLPFIIRLSYIFKYVLDFLSLSIKK